MEDVLAEPETMETDAEEKGEKRSEETAVSSLPS
jgi:hypothetical protein